MTTRNVFNGHIVHCKDLDSGDEFNVEVLINEKLDEAAMLKAAEGAAAESELVSLSGNGFEYEYIQLSGRRIETIVTKTRNELSPITDEARALLEQSTIG